MPMYPCHRFTEGGGSQYVKLIEQTVVAGQNTIETGVTIKRIITFWAKADGSNDNFHLTEWSSSRPTEEWAAWSTNSSNTQKFTVPNSSTTLINSISGTSFVFNVGSTDLTRFGSTSPVQFYIYY